MNFDTHDRVSVAYKKLKQMVYYEKHPLQLRRRLAEFECDADEYKPTPPEFDEAERL